VIAFIRGHKDHRADGGLRWGVEPICAVLSEHGCQIAPSTYCGRLAARRAAGTGATAGSLR
jgi:putative transposase